MEWLVPILFVLASLAQWWMQRNRQGQDEEQRPKTSTREKDRSVQDRREPPTQEEFGDLGDLLEALGRRRHESPPPPVEHTEPPVLPSPPPPKVPSPKPEPAPVLPPVFTAFPEAKIKSISEPTFVLSVTETPRVTFRPFPAAQKVDSPLAHRLAEKLRSPESVREAVILSEILAPPVSLR